jgi:flagellar motility protein MotE (MotC chaperone)
MMPPPSNSSRPMRPRFTRGQADPGALKQGPALRLLPVVIIAAVFMLGFRVQVVVRDITNLGTTSVEVGGQTALAQNAGAAAPEATPAATPTATPTAPADAAAPAGDAAPADGALLAENADSSAPPLPVNFDPSTLTKSEIDTLQRLAERRDMITQRERELEAKEGLLKAAESRIEGKIVQLQDLEKNIQGLLKKYDEQKQAEIEQLVKIYAAMKPKDAARIFDALEMPILVSVIQNMKEAKVAPIMAMMAPAKATALTEELTVRKQLPSAGGPG